mmetsp:Transcript_2491/g.5115  ORF Transcript_2491/g.5115 Transcript_2491/m.5115 type:complete len:103 (-) Transcript_2491:1746-2054(-)|eukprot:911625-Pleurochrysis_carterae.AAC.1
MRTAADAALQMMHAMPQPPTTATPCLNPVTHRPKTEGASPSHAHWLESANARAMFSALNRSVLAVGALNMQCTEQARGAAVAKFGTDGANARTRPQPPARGS